MNECMNAGMARGQLLSQIKAFDFAMIEMNLYLDTHPCDRGALELLEAYRNKRNTLVSAYESRFGNLVVTADDVCTDKGRWTWVDDPWPWECV